MSTKTFFFILIIPFILINCNQDTQNNLPAVTHKTGQAEAYTSGNKLVVNTGKTERTWEWTGKGLVTTSFVNKSTGKEWANTSPDLFSDWDMPGGVSDTTRVKLISLKAGNANDEGFTNEHIEVIAEVAYPGKHLQVQYVIWAYPDSKGIRTQLKVKSLPGYVIPDTPAIHLIPEDTIPFNMGIDRDNWKVIFTDSYLQEKGKPEYVLDGNRYTVWKTELDSTKPGKPHELIVDMGTEQEISGIAFYQSYQYRMEGTVKHLTIYVSGDTTAWGKPVAVEDFERSQSLEKVEFAPQQARYIRFVAQASTIPHVDRWMSSLGELYAFNNANPIPDELFLATDHLPVDPSNHKIRLIGYYHESQFRNTAETEAFKEEVLEKCAGDNTFSWPGIMSVKAEDDGLILVKESQKCANIKGHNTGEFEAGKNGLTVTGWGLLPHEIKDYYRKCWATWAIVYQGGTDERELAVKEFHRTRFPVHEQTDYTVKTCTWGTGSSGRECRDKAIESEVLKEMQSAVDLGIEDLDIDDGWQCPLQDGPDNTKTWRPHPEPYPNGWTPVVKEAKKNDINLGLWVVSNATLEDLTWNYDRAGFINWKFDGHNMRYYDEIEKITNKARKFHKYTNQSIHIAFDNTEIYPRTGYFWALEYGSVWLQNRIAEPGWITYIPHLTLRDVWELSKYININKLQIPIQNINRVDTTVSDAHKHSHSYCFAVAMLAQPMFFHATYMYTDKARDEIRPMIQLYKEYRDEIWDSYILPIGHKPNNASWTGFQVYKPGSDTGFLLIFREINNTEDEKTLQLRFLENQELELTDLLTNTTENKALNERELKVIIAQAPGFRLFRYIIKQNI